MIVRARLQVARALALSAHLSERLGLHPANPEIQGYVSALSNEGWDLPEDFDELTVDELKEEPFCLKPGHLKKVSRSRLHKKANSPQVEETAKPTVRGRCSLCGLDVLDSQPRVKAPDTGLYQHQNCPSVGRGGLTINDSAPSQARTDADAAVQIETVMTAAAQPTIPTESARSRSTHPQPPTSSATTVPLVSAEPRTKPLLPESKHAFLSYQWDVQDQVKEIKEFLSDQNVKCWMDIDGGMKSDIYDSMAEGVQGAACIICFMTQAYQDSANCKLELKFAQQSGVPIIPVMMQENFTAKGWLGILTSGSIWTPMHAGASVRDGIGKLIDQVRHLVPGVRRANDASDCASETSDNTESFDVGAWGDDMFSLAEMREELERLRDESSHAKVSHGTSSNASGYGTDLRCKLPAMVPVLPRGLFVTPKMEIVLAAVLSDSSTPQIGFCGMGGIGKTTVSTWVAHNESVQTKFGMIAWVSLGQAPSVDTCISLLYLQLAGTELTDGLSPDQKHQYLTQAFLGRSVLLVLDDCWDAEVGAHFNWIDKSTNSKVLISSRVRDALDGGDVIDVTVPSKTDAIKMLLSTAEMEMDATSNEVSQVVDLCKRLPLTIGIAGKLIRQLAHGASMSDSDGWADVVGLLQAELNDPDGDLSIEESVIRASIKSIPEKMRKQVTRLFHGFALAPEDVQIPLPVLGMLFDANSTNPNAGSMRGRAQMNGAVDAPLLRVYIRKYLKVLIDRSLVLGTVDRPQLHDVMLDYVKKELAGGAYTAAQRRLVESLRTAADQLASSGTGKYIKAFSRHHITESYDVAWGSSEQAMSWLEDHANGVPNTIAVATASVLPDMEAVAKQAEDAKAWWSAALRWHALAHVKMAEAGAISSGFEHSKRAVEAAAHIVMSADGSYIGDGSSCTQYELDSFNLKVLVSMIMTWDPAILAQYGEAVGKLMLTDAGKSQPLLAYSVYFALEWYPALMSGNADAYIFSMWHLHCLAAKMADRDSDAYASLTEEERHLIKPCVGLFFMTAGDLLLRTPSLPLLDVGPNGDYLVSWANAYSFEDHHLFLGGILACDCWLGCSGHDWLLTMQYGRVADAMAIMEKRMRLLQRVDADASDPTRCTDLAVGISSIMVACHVHGQSQMLETFIGSFDGLTFDTVNDYLIELTAHVAIITSIDHKGAGGGLLPLRRLIWQFKSFMVMHTDVPAAKAVAWLESLPDDEAFYQYSLTMPTHDHGGFFGVMHQTCWIALAHEKVGLHDGALRFCRLALETDLLKAGVPHTKWACAIAEACKGRVMAKLQRHAEALLAFQAAVAASKQSYNLIEAFAYRELANYAAGGEAAAQASKDLAAKLETFNGMLTQLEFAGLNIGPGKLNYTA